MIHYAAISTTLSIIAAAVFWCACVAGKRADERDDWGEPWFGPDMTIAEEIAALRLFRDELDLGDYPQLPPETHADRPERILLETAGGKDVAVNPLFFSHDEGQ